MATGIIIIDKPADWTSQDVAAKLRGIFQERRVGHGGTLDPMATGVLPVFVGRATRAATFFESAEKEYIATLQLGLTTDTEDTSGTVLSQRPVQVTQAQVRQALAQFLGPQMQQPPMYSAVKIGGRKLYELARAGKQVERPARPITIFELELLSGQDDLWRFRVRCSKGTYVRTLCRQIGEALGCGGCMAALRRIRAGCYTLEQAVTLESLQAMDAAQRTAALLPVDSLFQAHPSLALQTAKQIKQCRNGAAIAMPGCADGTYRVYDPNGTFLMLGSCKNGIVSTIKSFFEVNDCV